MTLQEQMAVDARTAFLNPTEFAEEITYTPVGSAVKQIKAVVVCKGLEPAGENTGRSLKNQAEVFISTDAVVGVAVINRKEDRVTLNDIDGISREARVHDVLGQDCGLWHLLVGW